MKRIEALLFVLLWPLLVIAAVALTFIVYSRLEAFALWDVQWETWKRELYESLMLFITRGRL